MIACRYTYKNTDNKIILKLNFIDETSVFNFVFLSITCIMEKKKVSVYYSIEVTMK